MIEHSAIQISETPTGKTLHLGPPSQPSAFCLSTCAWHSLTPPDAPANVAENKSGRAISSASCLQLCAFYDKNSYTFIFVLTGAKRYAQPRKECRQY